CLSYDTSLSARLF
nr:immunoglobulin light chain junction region [Macaca mulatta]MPN65283.1 immunoglobulin light chain junction region [Macaca mulatta]MPN65347.1 immunoglobulin light chain junction region [Macaca mulatta]MPN65362.1 immunoglobulin light chain junction region [Macaca mulatta]MPN65364.1 immunoglobulin light chain junction region [Macaca mulatta]